MQKDSEAEFAQSDADLFSGSNDYVFPEDYDPVRRRSAGERLSFLTGVSYLVGLSTGGLVGFREGLIKGAQTTTRLRLNTVLNRVGVRGTRVGNAAGTAASRLAMLYVIADELIGRAVGTTNMFTSMTSAACVVAGPRAAAVASVGAATVVGAYGLITSVSMPSISDVTERARDMFKSKPKEDKTSLADYEKEFVSEKKKV